MAGEFLNPGAAASASLLDYLAQRKAEQQQAFLDSLKLRDEQRLEQNSQLDHAERLQRIKAGQDAIDVGRVEKARENLLPGDVADPKLVDMAGKYPETSGLFKHEQATNGFGVLQDPTQDPLSEMPPAGTGVLKVAPPQQAPDGTPLYKSQTDRIAAHGEQDIYKGDAKQRLDETRKLNVKAFMDNLPKEMASIDESTPQGQAKRFALGLKWYELTGTQPPASLMGSAAGGSVHATENGFERFLPDGTTILYTDKNGKPIRPDVTQSTKTMKEGAGMLLPHVSELVADAAELDKRGMFGPIMSRVRDLASKFGTTGSPEEVEQSAQQLADAISHDPQLNNDRLVGKFATELALMTSGAGRVHGGARGGGSIQMINYLKGVLSSDASLPMFLGRMDALGSYLNTYANGPGVKATETPGGATTPPPAGAAPGASTGDPYDNFVKKWKGAPPVNPNPATGAPAPAPVATPAAPPVRLGASEPAPTTISQDGVSRIKQFEVGGKGVPLAPYQDSGTGLAIGYGMHTWQGQPVTPDLRITQKQADTEMQRQLDAEYVPAVRNALKVPVSQQQFDALVSVAWNAGPTVVRGLIARLNKGEKLTDADFQRSATVRGKPNEAVSSRRGAEAAPFVQ